MTATKAKNNSQKPVLTPSLRKVIIVLLKRKKLIAAIFLTTLVTVSVLTFLQKPVYQASAQVLIEPEEVSDSMVMFRLSPMRQRNQVAWMNTEIAVLQSRPIAERIVYKFRLYKHAKGKQDTLQVTQKQLDEAIRNLQKNINVETGENSNVITLSYQHARPELAAEIVNSIIDEYLNYRQNIFNNSDNYRFYKQQLQQVGEKLRDLEKKEVFYKRNQNIFSTSEQAEVLRAKLLDYNRSLTVVTTTLIGKKAKLRIINEQLTNNTSFRIPAIEVAESPSRENYISSLRSQLLSMEIERESLLRRFRPTYKKIIDLNEQIAIMQRKIRSEIDEIIEQEKTGIQGLEVEKYTLEKMIRDLDQDIQALAQKDFEIKQINRGIKENRELYSILLKQKEEARLSDEKLNSGANVRIISPAIPPVRPAWPKKKLNLILGLVLGFAFSFLIAFSMDYFDQTINTIEDLRAATGIRVLGSVKSQQRELV